MMTTSTFHEAAARATLRDESAPPPDRLVARGVLAWLGRDEPVDVTLEDAALAAELDAADDAALALVEALGAEDWHTARVRPDAEAGVLGRTRLACLARGLVAAGAGAAARAAAAEAEARFDACVAPLAHRLVCVNPLRVELTGALARAGTDDAPWLTRGRGVSLEAVRALDEVAEWCAAFPEAAAELDRLRAFSSRLRTPPAQLRTLRGAVDAARARDGLRLAAAGKPTRTTVFSSPACVVAYEEPGRLLVDVLEDGPDEPPYLELAGATEIPSRAVRGTLGRFDFRLGAEVLDAVDAVLVLPLRSGTTRLPLAVR